MNPSSTVLIPFSKHSKPNLSQQVLDPLAINRTMNSRHTCLCCSTVLLRHMRLQGLYWRCQHCRADMPI